MSTQRWVRRPRWEVIWTAPPSNPWAWLRGKLRWWWLIYKPKFLRPKIVYPKRDLVLNPYTDEELEAIYVIRKTLYRLAQERVDKNS